MNELNISQSAMHLSSGSLHSNERPSHNTCFHMVIQCLEKGKGQGTLILYNRLKRR